MAVSPVKFLFGFLLLSIILWLLFMFASRLLSWILSRTVGVSVGFRVSGWKCLRDIMLKFNKGAIESVSVGEIRLSLRRSLVKLGVGFFSRDPKLQLLICDLEIVMRPSYKSSQKVKAHKQWSSGCSSGRGKWMVVANMARFLSVSLTDLAVKTSRSTIEVKELSVDISKVGGSKPDLFVKLRILPILVHVGEPRGTCDQLSNFNSGEFVSSGQASIAMMDKSSSLFSCEELTLCCEFGHNREVGILIKSVDITSGEVAVKINEDLVAKKKSSLDTSSTNKNVGPIDSMASKKSQEKQAALAALTKFTSKFPEKVCINLPKLDVSFIQQEHNLVIHNNIMGIQLRTAKSQSSEDVGESTHLDFQLEFSEIHLFREAGTSILEILKVYVVSLFDIPIEATSPVRAAIDVKLGGTRCNIIMSRLKPWLKLQSSKKKKKKAMTLREEKPPPERPPSTDDMKIIMWTCTLSAPEMTVVLYSISGSPLYHVSNA